MPASAPTVMLQGVEVPAQSVQPDLFYALTQRKQAQNKVGAFAGLGSSDSIKIRQQGIIAGIELRVSGTIVTTPGTGSINTTRRWPYDLVKRVRLNANGSANLINCSGLKLKAHAAMQPDLDDRGVSNTIVATAAVQGTLAQSSETWGFASGQVGVTADPTFDLYYYIPVAADPVTLRGAIFAQTAATELNLDIDWATQSEVFTLAGDAAVTMSGVTYSVVPVVYSIPAVNGLQIVPDLSEFHSLIETRSNVLANGDNDVDLVGFGVGRKLLRAYFQVWNGSAPQTPLAMSATNYGPLSWVYGLNEVPETLPTGQALRYQNERLFNDDIGAVWGFGAWDFANKFALRDLVDGNKVTNLRLRLNIPSGVSLTNATAEYVQETLSAAPTSA
jgi:hypothetical protein